MPTRPVAEGVFSGEGNNVHLLAGKRKSDGKIVFPRPAGAEAGDYETIELANKGKLWSFTIQRFRPKTPYNGLGDDKNYKPFGVGYVELPGQIIVESRIITDDFSKLKIGMPMELFLEPYAKDANGTEVVTYAFRPAA